MMLFNNRSPTPQAGRNSVSDSERLSAIGLTPLIITEGVTVIIVSMVMGWRKPITKTHLRWERVFMALGTQYTLADDRKVKLQ